MIIQFDELGYGGKRMITFAAQSEEEDALLLHIHHCYHKGRVSLLGSNGEQTFGWVHPNPAEANVETRK